MFLKKMKVNSPLFIQPAKKKYYLNLNNYRNWHFRTSNNLKKAYCELVGDCMRGVVLRTPINISFTLFKGSNRRVDRSNILSVTEKFFCDALVNHGCIIDDNDDYIESTHYYSGGIDRDNPRVEIKIYENSKCR